jgi:hypothetical protein
MSTPVKNFDISALVDDLQPVRPLKPLRAMLVPAAITIVALAVIGTLKGWRPDLIAGRPEEMFLLRAGILGLLGITCAHAVVSMARPSVGKHSDRWQMALAAALLFPLAAMIVVIGGNYQPSVFHTSSALDCLRMSGIGALATAIPMIFWLRRGAPTSPERAGWLTGLAAGGLGAFAYNFHCPFSDIVYIGVWYSLTVALCAVIGRIVVPPLVRW